MEFLEYNKENFGKIERIILIIYTFYCIGMSFTVIKNDWESWYLILINIGLVFSWFLYIGQYKTYLFRAFFTTIMLHGSIIFYCLQLPDLFQFFLIYIAVVIALGLYGIPELVFVSGFSSTVIIIVHGALLGTVHFDSMNHTIYILLQFAALYAIEGIIYYLVKKQRDVGNRLLNAIEILEEAEESKDDFLANVSHEIRTPINAICGMSDVVLHEEISPKVRDNLKNIQTAGRNLLSVVSDILDFSELQSGQIDLAEETYNITSTINDVINMAMAMKNEKPIELIVDCDAAIPAMLIGDEQKIRRVIMNLVNNAIKFTNRGCVSIKIEHRKTSYGINLIVTVKDTGIGMKAESIEKLFTSFNQVDAKRNRQEGGIGLGLAISQAIVSMMGGFITVQSEFGKGSQIRFVAPQQVKDEKPAISINKPETINAAVYTNMELLEHFSVRDEYSILIEHIVKQLQIRGHVCRNLSELKRRAKRENFTHLFIGYAEYKEDEKFFDRMSVDTKVVVVIEHSQEKHLDNPRLLHIFKPLSVLPVAMVLNGELSGPGMDEAFYRHEKFIAPDIKMLVVDDNRLNLKVMEGMLKPYQIQVVTAMSGKEALEKIETKDYDLVFMDHMMPEMDGIEALHHIRQKQGVYYKTVPVVAFTANAIAGMREMFLSEGFQDYIVKPVELSVLERVLQRIIPENKMTLIEDKPLEKAETASNVNDFKVGDLDVDKGIVYSGTKENYIEVLKLHANEGNENKEKLNDFYKSKNWKEYTILIHALKSSMLSIGATALSEMAKELETAAKRKNEAFIFQHHEQMMKEYERVLEMIIDGLHLNMKKEETGKEDISKLEELQEDAFALLVKEFEEAVYTFEDEAVAEVLKKMQQFQYRGHALKKVLYPVEKKIQMSDLMSALEVVKKIKKKLEK